MEIKGLAGRLAGVEPAGLYQKQAFPLPGQAPSSRKDEATISNSAREVARIAAEVKKAPDVREEKVRTLQEAIASGRYQVSGEAVAQKMIRDAALGDIL